MRSHRLPVPAGRPGLPVRLSRAASALFRMLVLLLTGTFLLAGASGCTEPPRRGSASGEPPHTPAAEAQSAAAQALGPGSFVRTSEAAGGHTLLKHVGRSDAELAERLEREPKIRASSSFTDEATAEAAVRGAIEQQWPRIESWLREGASQRLPIEYRGQAVIGRGISRGDTEAGPRTSARVVLERNADAPAGFFVLTAYPE